MAGTMMFQYQPGTSILHRSDIRVKLAGMITVSLLLINTSPFRLLLLLPVLLFLHIKTTAKGSSPSPPSLLFLMPAVIFFGNLLSLLSASAEISLAFLTAVLKSLSFIYILWMAQLFTMSSDPMCITPAFYKILKWIPFIPAGRISAQMGLSLTLIPMILDEMNEIKEAMLSRCGWNVRKPLRNLIHMGQPLLNGVLMKAEALADAMESRLFTEEATEPEQLSSSCVLFPILFLTAVAAILLVSEYILQMNRISTIFTHFY